MDNITFDIIEETIDIELKDVVIINSNSTASLELDFTCGETINSNRVVVVQNGKIFKADGTNVNHFGNVVGISKQAGILNEVIKVVVAGNMLNNGWNLTSNQLCYFNNAGEITQTVPTNANFILSVGTAINTNEINIKLGDYIIL